MSPEEFRAIVAAAIAEAAAATGSGGLAARVAAVNTIVTAAAELSPAAPGAVYVGKCEFHRSRIWYHREGVRCDCPCHDTRPRPRPSIFPNEETQA